MKSIATVTNPAGVTFNVRMVRAGESYGLDSKLTHGKADPLVEFYDARYPHTDLGQFVSRYNLSVLLGADGFSDGPAALMRHGLLLNGTSPSWTVSGENMQVVFATLVGELAAVLSGITRPTRGAEAVILLAAESMDVLGMVLDAKGASKALYRGTIEEARKVFKQIGDELVVSAMIQAAK